MRDNDNLIYGIIASLGAVLCFAWLKGDSLSLLGLINIKYSTIGIVLAVVGVFNLLVSGIVVDLIGWVLEHWLVALAVVAVLLFLKNDGKFEGFSLPKIGDRAQQVQSEEQETVSTKTSEDTQYRPRWNTGVCQNLAEDICVVALFIDDSEKQWADYTIGWFLENKIEPGLRFIEEEAAEYGQNIRVEYITHTGVAINQNILSYNVQKGGNVFDALEEASKSLGFSTAQEMLAYHRDYTGIQQIVYMLCANKNGRPYAYGAGSSDANTLECCVVFCNSENSNASSYNTIFHEVLHLFGAEDYYAEGTERVNREKMAQRLCPNDIMLNSYNAGLRDIGRYTAYCIGWLDEMPEEYNHPDWWS